MRKTRVGDKVYWVCKDAHELRSGRVTHVSGAYLKLSSGHFAVPDTWVSRTPVDAWEYFVEEMLKQARTLEKRSREYRRLAKLGNERAKERRCRLE